MCKVFCMTPGTVDDCIANLNSGNMLIIAPGGVREALFSNPINYQIKWSKRLGFAKVVLGANVVCFCLKFFKKQFSMLFQYLPKIVVMLLEHLVGDVVY